jgi:hypothetical protein
MALLRRRGSKSPASRSSYVPAHLLGDRTHVIIDGAPREATTFTLSHWPNTPTPPGLNADLSTEIARRALSRPDLLPTTLGTVSIDHYDVDGLIALGIVVLAGLDDAHGPLLVEAARAGDFDVVTAPDAARIAFALNALDVDDQRWAGTGAGDPLERVGHIAVQALEILFDLAADPLRFESLWRQEWDAYQWSVRALADGWATIEERPELDLAVVRVDTENPGALRARWESAPLHRAAVHSATAGLRVATVAGDWREFHYRYESWVRLATYRPRRRVDLDRLAQRLTAAEEATGRWSFDGAGSITGSLHLMGPDATSTIEPERFLDLVSAELAVLDEGPAAWDPYGSA